MKIKLDVAGMYFGIEVDVPTNATIKDVMDAAVIKTAGAKGSNPTFEYSSEALTTGNLGVNSITITHRGKSAKSRQTVGATPSGRTYPNGIYHFSDDGFMEPAAGKPLKPIDPNKAFVGAWQYYVYDTTGRDLARAAGAPIRRIVPFDTPSPNGYVLSDGYTVVWRLVTIFVRSTHDDRGELPGKFVQGSVKV
jgi:hypothetical protein